MFLHSDISRFFLFVFCLFFLLTMGCKQDCSSSTANKEMTDIAQNGSFLSDGTRQRLNKIDREFYDMKIYGFDSLYGTSSVSFQSLSWTPEQLSRLNDLITEISALLPQVRKPVVLWALYSYFTSWKLNPFIKAEACLDNMINQLNEIGRKNSLDMIAIQSLLASCYLLLESQKQYDAIYLMMLQASEIVDSIDASDAVFVGRQQALVYDMTLIYCRIRPCLSPDLQEHFDTLMDSQGQKAQKSLIRYMYCLRYEIECFIPVLITMRDQERLETALQSLQLFSRHLDESDKLYLVPSDKASKWNTLANSGDRDDNDWIPGAMFVAQGLLKQNARIQENLSNVGVPVHPCPCPASVRSMKNEDLEVETGQKTQDDVEKTDANFE